MPSTDDPLKSDNSNPDETGSTSPVTSPRDIAAHHKRRTGAVPPERIGPYKILEMLGEGGMGTVYLAEQTSPVHRRVALKIVKLGMDTKQVVARFEAEREALALMNHPGVAKVFDAGVSEQGRPYFVMEHVPGIAITDYCDQNRLRTHERLELFMQVCHAVQHAHQKGIIHRDIKPSNVLVAVQDGTAVPKVIDFGVAKATQQRLTENTLFTEQGQLIGTPGYMSPEQAEMSALDIDTRTDIYSLGVLLYELLVGARPFDDESLRQAGLAEIQRIIREVEPPKPSTRLSTLEIEPPASAGADLEPGKTARTKTRSSLHDIARKRRADPRALTRLIRGDLDWITMKALEKDRTRRYDSASDFAADIHRHLRHEPVVAGPPTAGYRIGKFVRRNQGMVTAATVVFLVLVAGIVVATHQRNRAVTAERQQSRARKEAEDARDAEETQRKLAEQRAKETEQVAEFQSSMLSE
ncbi:MAG: serine/threonine protein kinase, partial [Phycisphaerae bacterium]